MYYLLCEINDGWQITAVTQYKIQALYLSEVEECPTKIIKVFGNYPPQIDSFGNVYFPDGTIAVLAVVPISF